MATLELLALQVAALRPYLVRSLPRRFLDASVVELGEFRPVSVLFANFHDFSAILNALGDDATTAANVLNAYSAAPRLWSIATMRSSTRWTCTPTATS